ncbi:carbohydrate ABC transporter permease [Paenibacillus koleovorans]|uniref:carbohydrate ABC transporter permease n=1 Tax=Paenibacillus koleovorans TaxID=121608 RepID=UPI000FDC0BED|nr:carbohydrate ABC transporter permease [Paenibacillus koleovorans]
MSRIRDSAGDRTFNFLNYLFMTLFFLAVLYPILYVISSSFSSPSAVMAGRVKLWPVEPSLVGYKALFEYSPIWRGYANSILYTVTGTIVNVVLTILAAYPLSRKDCYGRNWIMLLITFTMLFSGGLIPTYLVIDALGMVNTIWAMIIPSAITVWNVILARTYFQSTISDELLEAAQIDGCNDFKFVGYVVLPLSKAIIAVISLFYAVSHWNAFFDALIYLRDRDKYPLQMFLRDILVLNAVDTSMIGVDSETAQAREGVREVLKYSIIIVASLPVMLMYPFVQKYFVKGVMIGSLKG